MPTQRRLDSTDQMGLGDNIWRRRTPTPGATPGAPQAPQANENPTGMPGTEGNPNTGVAGGQPPQAPQAPQLPTVPIVSQPQVSTRLMEGDTRKLADPGHAAKSPKYDFLQLAQQNKYGYGDLDKMLAELQGGPNKQHWEGWTADKDKLRYTGDPSKLGAQWDGVTEVDAIGGFNSGNPQGFRWGVNDGGAPLQQAELAQSVQRRSPVAYQTQAELPSVSGGGPGAAQGADWTPQEAAAAGLGWVDKNHPLYGTPGFVGPKGGTEKAPEQPGGGTPGPGGPAVPTAPTVQEGAPPASNGDNDDDFDVDSIIKQFLSGDLNQGIVDRRVDSARDVLNKQRSSSTDTLNASLAERGQLGSGAGEEAAVRLDRLLGDDFAGTVSGIYADEAAAADDRLAQALGLATTKSIADRQADIDQFNADTGRLNSDRDYELGSGRLDLDAELGRGDLDVRRRQTDNQGRSIDNDFALGNRRIDVDSQLGNRRMDIDSQLGNRGIDADLFLGTRGQDLDYSTALGRLGLDRDRLGLDASNSDWDHVLRLLEQLGLAGRTSSDGYI